jgi:hypothetical protein
MSARSASQSAGLASKARGNVKIARLAAAAASLAAHRSRRGAREAAGRVFSTVWYGEGLYDESRRAAEKSAHLVLLRCVFGNPFRPTTPDRAWLTWNHGTIPKLAQAVYEKRSLPDGSFDLTRLAVLADALEEAGCTDADILAHVRGPGPHVRGCWVIDLLTGKQ